MKRIIILLSVFLLNSFSDAQRMPDRFITFNPLFNTAENLPDDSTSYINSAGGWGEFAAYRIERDFEHAWNQRLGAFIEFFRTGSSSSLSFVSNIEFIANPDNDISFKPRSIFWEEGILYTQKTGSNFWQIAYMHRCKHDIDNYRYGVERALIFGSLQGKYIIPFDFWNESDNALITLRGELYTLRQDNRYPKDWMPVSSNWKQLIGSIGVNFNFVKPISQHYWHYYFNSYSMLNFYSKDEGYLDRFNSFQKVNLNGGIRTGISIRGKAEFRIGLTYEYLSDTGINPFPKKAHLISFGVIILNHSSYR